MRARAAFGRCASAALLAASMLALGCGDGASGGGEGGGGAGGSAPALVAEAGFVELPVGTIGPTGKSRMFFSFRPADHDAATAPLVVLFNGGPGVATTSVLLPFGTGPSTIDPDPHVAPKVKPNPASWTRFANLLYLDSRLAGFSYALRDAGCEGQRDQGDDNQRFYLVDAGDFVIGVLGFLDSHPALVASPVVIAGESYGGTRAILMEMLLLHYDAPLPPTPMYPLPSPDEVLPWLHDRVQQHVDAAHPDHKGKAASVAEMAAQFGHLALIEPSFGGEADFAIAYEEKDPVLAPFFAKDAKIDQDDVRLSTAEGEARLAHAAEAMRDPEMLTSLLGVDAEHVQGLPASQRDGGVRVPTAVTPDVVADEKKMRTALGALGKSDAYWIGYSEACAYGNDITSGVTALAMFPELRLFMTRARYDATVDTEALVAWWRSGGLTATIDEHAPKGAARPGVLTLKLDADVTFRLPKYDAGHEVTTAQPAELAADVEDWLRAEKILP